MEIQWYHLDADNNKKDPENTIWFCERCKRGIKQFSDVSLTNIVLHPVHPWFRIATPLERNTKLIGSDCLKYVIKEYGEVVNFPDTTDTY